MAEIQVTTKAVTDSEVEAVFDSLCPDEWPVDAVRVAATLRGWRSHLEGVASIHRAEAVQMIDEEASIEANDEVLADVMVCRECFNLAYPSGEADEYYIPEVFWPCATAKAMGEVAGG